MKLSSDNREKVTVVTLGPTGTCHERAAIQYMAFQGVKDFEIELIGDFFYGLERIRLKDNAFLIQCSAHPKVHEITERYWAEVFVVDTLGKAEFVARADAICQTAEKEREQATKRASNESEGSGPDEARAFTEAVLAPVIKMTEELAALTPPSRTTEQVAAIVAAFEGSVAKLRETALDSASATAFAEPDRLAGDYGLTSCTI